MLPTVQMTSALALLLLSIQLDFSSGQCQLCPNPNRGLIGVQAYAEVDGLCLDDGCRPLLGVLTNRNYQCGTCLTNVRDCDEDDGMIDDTFGICMSLRIFESDLDMWAQAANVWTEKLSLSSPVSAYSATDILASGVLPDWCSPAPIGLRHILLCGSYQNLVEAPDGVVGAATTRFIRNIEVEVPVPIIVELVIDIFEMQRLGLGMDVRAATITHEIGHAVGLGAREWFQGGLIDARNRPCQYLGGNATREWQAISGCSSTVPLEQEGGLGENCGHWSNSCVGRDIMSTKLNVSADPPLFSSITIGALEDYGYSVNYDDADEMTTADLDPSCRCDDTPGPSPGSSSAPTTEGGLDGVRRLEEVMQRPKRRLSDVGLIVARAFGRKLLREAGMKGPDSVLDGGQLVAHGKVSVIYMENGERYHVSVTSED